jgi:hypothetical protein
MSLTFSRYIYRIWLKMGKSWPSRGCNKSRNGNTPQVTTYRVPLATPMLTATPTAPLASFTSKHSTELVSCYRELLCETRTRVPYRVYHTQGHKCSLTIVSNCSYLLLYFHFNLFFICALSLLTYQSDKITRDDVSTWHGGFLDTSNVQNACGNGAANFNQKPLTKLS